MPCVIFPFGNTNTIFAIVSQELITYERKDLNV